jgi:DNA gyrase subunit A
LDGFVTVFDALDEIIRIIRKSDGKADAASKIMAKFKLDDEQTDAILELKLYRLAKLEILVIQEELKDKRKRAKEIEKLLNERSGKGRWAIVRGELDEVVKGYGAATKRRTLLSDAEQEVEFTAEDFIVAEDNHVLVTTDGWVKRQKEIKDPTQTRLREGDSVLECLAGSTRSTVVFFSNFGTAYTARIIDIPATTGYGEPIQKLFKLKDGEAIVTARSMDPRTIGNVQEFDGYFPENYGFAASDDGYAMTFSLSPFVEPSTRTGRKFARPKEGSKILGVHVVTGSEAVVAVSKQRRALVCDLEEVAYLASAGRGVMLMKLAEDDAIIAVTAGDEAIEVKTSLGGTQKVSADKYEKTSRGGKGKEVIKRGTFVEVVRPPVSAPQALTEVTEA